MRRREAVLGGGLALSSFLAGCIEGPSSSENDSSSGSAAFFSLYDWGNHVGGSAMEFSTPIEVGEMGHGWDPHANLVPEIAQHDVFLYLGTPEFQWAVDAATELEGETDIALIDGMDAIDRERLLPFTGSHENPVREPDTDVDYDPQRIDIEAFELIHEEEIVAAWHGDHWDGELPPVPRDDRRRLRFHVRTVDGHVLPLGEVFTVSTEVAEDAPGDLVDTEDAGDGVAIAGRDLGQTALVWELAAEGTAVFDTGADPLAISVTGGNGSPSDPFHDPHVWVDPVFVQQIVTHLGQQLAERFPDDADVFRDNAESYANRVDAVHESFEELAEKAQLDVAVAIAHDSFQYWDHRYGFEIRTPVGVTADAAESIEDLAHLADTIDTYDIDTLLFDPFEAPDPDRDIPQGARVLLEETSAENAEPLSVGEGNTPAWRDAGYGWVEQMDEINLPALRKALRVP